ncbi:MAG: arsenite S-adenosylmethyltransferase [Chloroflexi bacterium RBG_16_56_11]|nr:MAG: arsenite S-adenosylmethyltransferase [Chloroflexi bacterium RBG_16_56_11]
MKDTEIKKSVREGYARVAREKSSCCGPKDCDCSGTASARDVSRRIGYSEDEMNAVPEGANLGLGCGNPVALASLRTGETVLDLGSGAGFDCFLAAKQVGETGRVIGVDMTPEMIDKARGNAARGHYNNVEFRLGEIENLPAADNTADVIISNCVINLAPDKKRVFNEAFRVLKPGGRLMVSDIVLTQALPADVMASVQAYIGCVAGAAVKGDYLSAVKGAGFEDIKTIEESTFAAENIIADPAALAILESLKMTPERVRELASTIKSVRVQAVKPGR